MPPSKLEFDQNSLIKSLLTHEWWTTFELASLLTSFPVNFDNIEIAESKKPFVIIPPKSFNLKKCEKNFQNIFKDINQDLEYERLAGKRCHTSKGVNFIVKPFDGLVWAIQKKFQWPLELQNTLSIRFKQKKQLNPWFGKIEIMIITQYCTLLKKKTSPIEIIKDPMMRNYISKARNERFYRQIQKDIALVSRKKEKHWQNENANINKGFEETLKIIPDVLENHKSHSECNFSLLKVVIWTAAFIKTHEVLEVSAVRRMTLAQFIQEMMEDKVVSLYANNSPPFIVHYIKTEMTNFYDWLSEFLEDF